jgi:hypothetical protein
MSETSARPKPANSAKSAAIKKIRLREMMRLLGQGYERFHNRWESDLWTPRRRF